MAAHRFWRIRALTANDSLIAASEVQFHDAPGGAMVYSGAPISSGDYNGAYDKSLAFDGNTGTDWAAGFGEGAWIGYDFGFGNELDIVEVTYRARNDYPAQTPNGAAIDYSDDGATWATKWTTSFGGWSGGELKTRVAPVPTPPPAPGFHQFWRLKFDTSDRGFCSCASLAMRDVVDGPDVTTTVEEQAIGGSAYSGAYRFALAFDRDAGTAWSSNGGADWVGFDFGAGNEKKILQFAYTGRLGDAGASPHTGGIEWSDDGAAWTRANDIGDQTGWADGETRVFAAEAPPPVSATPDVSQLARIAVEQAASRNGRVFELARIAVAQTPVPGRASQLARVAVTQTPVPGRVVLMARVAVLHGADAPTGYGQMMVG